MNEGIVGLDDLRKIPGLKLTRADNEQWVSLREMVGFEAVRDAAVLWMEETGKPAWLSDVAPLAFKIAKQRRLAAKAERERERAKQMAEEASQKFLEQRRREDAERKALNGTR